MIVADLPYNPEFEAKVVNHVNELTEKFQDIKVYRMDLTDENVKNELKKHLKVTIKDQTLFVLKNPYEKGASNIDFDIFMQYPTLSSTYLKTVSGYDSSNINEVLTKMAKLSPHESCLLYLYDKDES